MLYLDQSRSNVIKTNIFVDARPPYHSKTNGFSNLGPETPKKHTLRLMVFVNARPKKHSKATVVVDTLVSANSFINKRFSTPSANQLINISGPYMGLYTHTYTPFACIGAYIYM